jgi:uncharacterized protein with HEPN domain
VTPRRAQDRFDDVLEATSYARMIVERGRATFDADVVVQLAGERVVELVAEAVSAVVDRLEVSYPDYPWHEPIGMRNVIAHEYWRTDPDLVWTALADDIPEVADMVRAVRDELGD